MTALAVALVAVIAGQLGAVVWLVYGRIADTRAMATERVAHTATNGLLERARFELDAAKAALAEQERINAGLEDVLAQYINAAPNADLARGDVLSRLVRAAKRQASGDSAASPGAVETVPDEPATVVTHPALMPLDD